MIRVGVNARLLSDPGLRGFNRYAVNLLARLPAAGVRPVLYSQTPVHPDHLARLPAGEFECRVAPPMRYLAWEHAWLPRQCRRDGVKVLHAPFNFGLPAWSPCPTVLTQFDAIDVGYYSRKMGIAARLRPDRAKSAFLARLARTVATRVITVSEHARRDIVRILRVPAGRIDVTYAAADPHFADPVSADTRAAVRTKYELTERYIFYVGGWEGRKNVGFLVRGFAAAGIAGLNLVLAGGNDSQRDELVKLADSLGVGDRLILLGWVPEPDLPALYAEARGFVYPSEYEGFGLQLCESMAAGCPVLAARATCLPEILGGGGETFSLADPAELGGLIRRLATDDAFAEDLQTRGGRRAADFSWDKCAAETAATYRRAIAPGGDR